MHTDNVSAFELRTCGQADWQRLPYEAACFGGRGQSLTWFPALRAACLQALKQAIGVDGLRPLMAQMNPMEMMGTHYDR